MSIEWQNTPTQWQNTGVEPSDTLKTNGYNGGDRPAADTFNHIFNNNYKCISEIQTQIDNLSGGSESDVSNATGTLAISHGGTGATSYSEARANLKLQISDCTSGDLLTYMSSLLNQEIGSFNSNNCTNQPENGTEHWNITVLYNSGTNAETHNMSVIAIGTNSKSYTNVLVNGTWQGWERLYKTSDSINADTVDGFHASSFSKIGQRHEAGIGMDNGYMFPDAFGNNTGIYAIGGDDLRLCVGGTTVMYSLNGRMVASNGTVYVQESQPTAPNGSLWAW